MIAVVHGYNLHLHVSHELNVMIVSAWQHEVALRVPTEMCL